MIILILYLSDLSINRKLNLTEVLQLRFILNDVTVAEDLSTGIVSRAVYDGRDKLGLESSSIVNWLRMRY